MKTQHMIAALVLTLSSGLALAATTTTTTSDTPLPPTASNVVTSPATPAANAKLPPNAQNALKQHQAAVQNGTAQKVTPSSSAGTMPQNPTSSSQPQGY